MSSLDIVSEKTRERDFSLKKKYQLNFTKINARIEFSSGFKSMGHMKLL